MIFKFFKWLRYRFSREWCYDEEVAKGNACDNHCNGIFGGGPETNWLSYSCMDCRFWSPERKVKRMRDIGRVFTPGDKVFVLERDECGAASDIGGFMFLAQNEHVVIVTPFINEMRKLKETLDYLVEQTAEDYNCELCVFPINDCFLSVEAAKIQRTLEEDAYEYADEEEDD